MHFAKSVLETFIEDDMLTTSEIPWILHLTHRLESCWQRLAKFFAPKYAADAACTVLWADHVNASSLSHICGFTSCIGSVGHVDKTSGFMSASKF
ncbi:hypothetical protein MUK42_28781 [Musa troglodytarum]|uniref:Uncharacterized protein n=1 Tax=Musa troglodytarum TaxID=320322 RepID=A0A9E7JNC6_9LILI|nr:hypothetical protein MUK42_28781 [Musa troglodytarum]